MVVTQGTEGESSYLADLVVASGKPIVLTGAQRRADEPDSDGPRNLAQAIRVVAAAEARFIRRALDTGARGLVVEAFGRGSAHSVPGRNPRI